MAARGFEVLDEVGPADVLQISFREEGIRRLTHLLVLARRGYLYIVPYELRRIERILHIGNWPPNGNRVVEVTVTDTFQRSPFEKAVKGYMKRPLRRALAETGSARRQSKRTVTAQKNPRISEPVDLVKIGEILESGLKHRELAEAFGVHLQTIQKWNRAMRGNIKQARSQTADLSQSIDTLHCIFAALAGQGLTADAIVAWWHTDNPELGMTPAEAFRVSKAMQIATLQAAERVAHEACVA